MILFFLLFFVIVVYFAARGLSSSLEIGPIDGLKMPENGRSLL